MAEFPPLKGSFAELHARLGSVPLDRVWMRPPPGTATEADLLAAWKGPDHLICELIDGTLLLKITTLYSSALVGFLSYRLGRFVEESDAGVVLSGKTVFRIEPGLILSPSVSFIPWEWFPGEELPDEEIGSTVPALVVEILNPWRTAAELERKVKAFLNAGARLAWLIDLETRTAKVYTSAKRFKEVDESGTLDGGKVLPGFRLPLAELFAATRRRKKKPR